MQALYIFIKDEFLSLSFSFAHCIVYPSIYSFWLLLWYLVAIVWSIHWFTASDFSCGILWPLYGLFIDLRLLITPMVSCGHCMVYPLIYGFWLLMWFLVAIVWSIHRFTASDYSCGILWTLYGLSIDLRLLITPVVSCGHCMVYPLIYSFWLLLWYLVAIVWSIHRFTASDYSCGILWPLYGLSIDLRLLITPVVSCGHCMVYPSIYDFRLLLVYPSIYGFWLLLWYLQAFLYSN
jgi:hypothetical protein